MKSPWITNLCIALAVTLILSGSPSLYAYDIRSNGESTAGKGTPGDKGDSTSIDVTTTDSLIDRLSFYFADTTNPYCGKNSKTDGSPKEKPDCKKPGEGDCAMTGQRSESDRSKCYWCPTFVSATQSGGNGGDVTCKCNGAGQVATKPDGKPDCS